MRYTGLVVIVLLIAFVDNPVTAAAAKKKKNRTEGSETEDGPTPYSDAIRKNPESAKPYSQFTKNVGFAGMQSMMDNMFAGMRSQMNSISKHGEMNLKNNRKQQDNLTYNEMQKGFKWAEKSMNEAIEEAKEEHNDDGSGGSKKNATDSAGPSSNRKEGLMPTDVPGLAKPTEAPPLSGTKEDPDKKVSSIPVQDVAAVAGDAAAVASDADDSAVTQEPHEPPKFDEDGELIN